MSDLRVAIIQSKLFWEDKEGNLGQFTEKIEAISNQDLIVLPEMFATGFTMDSKRNSEKMDGKCVEWMLEMSKMSEAAICGTLIIEEQGEYYNRLLFVRSDGKIEFYDKRHLFRMAKEGEHYTAGTERKVVEYRGWKICLNVCYDLRFPVWSRNVDDYDLLLYSANWPEKRIAHWSKLLKARAIENLSYVIGANRVGKDGNNYTYNGCSAIINPMGESISEMINDEGTIESSLSKEEIQTVRSRFGFLLDRDEFEVKI